MTAKGAMKRHRRRWLWLGALGSMVMVMALYASYPLSLRMLAGYLVVEQPMEKADALLVLSGGAPFRALEAAALYRQEWAPVVLLTQGLRREDYYVWQTLGIYHPEEHESNLEILLRQGVPPEDIVLLEQVIVNTRDEINAAAPWLREHGSQRVIIVTSKSHTRRVTLMWQHMQQGMIRGIVRWARGDPFDPRQTWWKDRGFAAMVLHEYLGLINYWLGFPL